MAPKIENFPNLNYRLKLLASNNVVLVEADNFESEIFTPHIVNGRIAFVNIIPNRRCCQAVETNPMNESQKGPRYLREQYVFKPKKIPRVLGGQSSPMCAPLANSTPARVNQKNSCGSMVLNSNSSANRIDITLPTPEPVRKALPAPPKLLEGSMLNLPKGVRASRIYHNPVEGLPEKLGRLVTSSGTVSAVRKSRNETVLNDDYKLPCSPSVLSHSSNKRPSRNFDLSARADSIARWQKVLTPVRTYTRHSKEPVMLHRPVSVESRMKASKFIPTYLVNPTQGPNVSQQIVIKKKKLIKDRKIYISPKSFQKQQKEALETYRSQPTTLHPSFLSFHKPRPYLESMAMSAFDLITNSNRNTCVAKKLNKQFRKGCVNKASSTYSKYKVLSTVPPLKQDEQVLELSQIKISRPTHDIMQKK